MTAHQMQGAAKRIMGRFYRFRHVFLIAASLLMFPTLLFSLHNLRVGWSRWRRRWDRYVIRFGGWLTIRKWMADFRKGDFLQRLQNARSHLSVTRQSG